MKDRILASLPAIVLGLLIAIGPQTFVRVCEVAEKPMKCHWMAQASLGIGIVIALVGVVALLVNASVRIGLNIAVFLMGGLEIAIATFLIGTCKMPSMHCSAITRPFLIVVSVVLMIAALIECGVDIKTNAMKEGKKN